LTNFKGEAKFVADCPSRHLPSSNWAVGRPRITLRLEAHPMTFECKL